MKIMILSAQLIMSVSLTALVGMEDKESISSTDCPFETAEENSSRFITLAVLQPKKKNHRSCGGDCSF